MEYNNGKKSTIPKLDSKKNTLEITIHENDTPDEKFSQITFDTSDENTLQLKSTGKYKKLTINNFYSDVCQQGAEGERLFKELLIQKKIPFFYIGQGAIGVEISDTIKKDMEACRPDFIIDLYKVGTIFIDVKSRLKKAINDSEKFFYLSKNEITQLSNLDAFSNINVWLAFISKEDLQEEKIIFHFVPVGTVKRYNKLLQQLLKERYNSLEYIHIPNELLIINEYHEDSEIQECLNLNLSFNKLNEDIPRNFIEKHGLDQR